MGKYLIYHEAANAGGLEWATTYHDLENLPDQAIAEAYATAEAELVTDDVFFTRWEWYNAAGDRTAEGAFVLITGNYAGEMMPIHYALYLRANTGLRIKRPSGRYIHGYGEGLTTDGVWNATGATKLTAYNTAIAAIGSNIDSDGQLVTSYSFRGFSRRRRMRRKVV